MKLEIDFATLPHAKAHKLLMAITAAYFDIEPVNVSGQLVFHTETAAAQTPLPLPTPAPSTAAVTPLPTAPVEQAVGAQVPMPVTLPPAPPPAPVAAAPMAPVAQTNPASVELDKEGLPWDARIHSSTKAKTADGAWRAKRGINGGDLVARVTAELRATMAVRAPAPQVVVSPQAPPAPPAAPAMPTAQEVFTPPPPAAVAIPASPLTFQQLMPLVTTAMLGNQIPQTALLEAINVIGLTTIPSLAQRPDLVPAVWGQLVSRYPVLAQAQQ